MPPGCPYWRHWPRAQRGPERHADLGVTPPPRVAGAGRAETDRAQRSPRREGGAPAGPGLGAVHGPVLHACLQSEPEATATRSGRGEGGRVRFLKLR